MSTSDAEHSGRIAELERRVAELEAELATRPRGDLLVPLDETLRLVRNLPLILFRIDAAGIFRESVGSGLTRLGLAEREAVGTSVHQGFPEIADYVRRAFAGEDVIATASGTFQGHPWTAISHYTLHRESGDVVGVSLDVTELADSLRDLAASERRFEALADTVPIGIARFDATGGCTYLNRRIRHTLGLTDQAASSFRWSDWFPHDEVASLRAMDMSRATQERPLEFHYPHGVDGERWMQIRVVAEPGPDGTDKGYVVTVTDITRHKRLEEELARRVAERTSELESANRELESFCYSISHDLRSPLRLVDGYCALLLADHGDRLDEVGHDHLARVRAASRRMGALIDDLLAMSRVGRGELKRKNLDLSTMAGTIVDELRRGDPGRQVRVIVADGLRADADETLVHSVLTNLLGNAWKFTSRRAEATIEFLALPDDDGKPCFCVRDDGAGFDPTYAGKLFQPFQRLHDPSDFEGNGIGLATVERIVSRHGGRLRAEGKPGKGAAFYFTLGD